MLGINIDAKENKIVLSPHFPAGWYSATVQNIRIGNATFDMCMKRTGESCFYTFTPHGNQPVNIEFSPTFPAGTKFTSILKDGNETPFASFIDQTSVSLLTKLKLTEPCLLQMNYDNGIEVLPALTNPCPGSGPEGIRIISYRLAGYKYFIHIEGESKTSDNIDVYIHNQDVDKIENGVLKGSDGEIYHITVVFDSGASRYQNKTVIIYLKQKPANGGTLPGQKKESKEKKENSPKCPRWD
jgi:hypothetical protein